MRSSIVSLQELPDLDSGAMLEKVWSHRQIAGQLIPDTNRAKNSELCIDIDYCPT